MKNILILLIILIPFLGFSQISDNFEDGNISDWTQSIPGHWAASDSLPINGIYSLHQNFLINVTANYHDTICTSVGSINVNEVTTIWRFQIKYLYSNPSASNNWNVFLMSDQDCAQIPFSSLNGYVLGVNFGSSTDDVLKLNKVSSGTVSNVINTSFVWNISGTIGVQVARTSSGVWEVYVDDDGDFDNLQSVGQGNDNIFNDFSYFGIVYNYTKTYCRKFWIDDLIISPDIFPPTVSSVEVISPSHLKLNFSEKLDLSSSQVLTNYLVNNSIGNPSSAVVDGTNKIVDLTFSSSLQENNNYSLNLTNIEDLAANKIEDTSVSFIWENIKISKVKVNSASSVDVTFSKTLDQTTAETVSNYSVDNSIGVPSSVTLDAVDKKLVHLTFSNSMQINSDYVLNVQNVKDIYGNIITTENFPFNYHVVQQFDIVFNELMIDVNPAPVALPANKYIELYNSSDYDIDLTNWTLQIGTNSPKTFPALTINSKGYVIICSTNAQSIFSQ